MTNVAINSRRNRLAAGILGVLLSILSAAPAGAQTHTRPVCRGGVQADDYSVPVDISADGRSVLFSSMAGNLIPGVTGWHLYLRDLRRCVTELVDVTVTGGASAVGFTAESFLSANGRYVAFASSATDLVPGGTNDVGNVFLRDLRRRTTELISVTHDGSPADDASWTGGVSADGRYVLFVSMATNLLPGGPPPNTRNVYLRDRALRSTRLIATVPPNSVAPAWTPYLSPDGRFSLITLLPTTPPGEQRWLTHLVNNSTLRSRVVSVSLDGDRPDESTWGVGVSVGGRFVLFNSLASDLVPGDTNGATDAFVRDMVAGQTRRISLSSTGDQANRGGAGTGISPDGRYVAFESPATNLVPGDTNGAEDVFVRDLRTGTTVRASLASDGTQPNGDSEIGKLSANGRFVAFRSYASNLVPNDTNGRWDVFVRDLVAGTTVRVSVG